LRRGCIAPLAAALPPTAAKKASSTRSAIREGANLDPALGHTRWRLFLSERARGTLFTAAAHRELATAVSAHIERLLDECRELDARDRALYVDFRSYLVDNCLTKVDRMSMACSIEARVPLLDKTVAELAFKCLHRSNTPTGNRRSSSAHRGASRAARVRLPAQGSFSIPIKSWFEKRVQGAA